MLPDGPVGVIVTGIVASWPGATVTGARLPSAEASSAAAHISPVLELTVGSNGAVVADIDVVTGSVNAPPAPNGPELRGVADQTPGEIFRGG